MCLPQKYKLQNRLNMVFLHADCYKHNGAFFITLRCFCLDLAAKNHEQVFTADGGRLEVVMRLLISRVFDLCVKLLGLLVMVERV